MKLAAPKLALLALLSTLAACGAPQDAAAPPPVSPPGYEAVEDNGFFIPAVDPALLKDGYQKTEVSYYGDEAPGTIVVDTFARKLYLVEENGLALRYGIAVGREGLSFRGSGVVGRKEEWPSWTPTANMVRTRPDLYAEYAGGMSGGLDNPLGARALYLYRGGRDSMFRIHGTIDNASIGHATSAGCIRLFNQDAIDLYNRTELGTMVRVRTRDESEQLEGKWMDDEYGFLIPYDEALIPVIEQRKLELEAKEAAEAEAAAELEATRTSAQRDAELEGTQG